MFFKSSPVSQETFKDEYDTSVPALGRVLLVDSEPASWRIVERFLGPAWLTITANDSMQAVKMLERGSYHTVIADYNLPGYNGIWLLQRAKDISPHVRRVLYSDSQVSGLVSHIRTKLVHHFLFKPYRREEFQTLFRIDTGKKGSGASS